MPECRAVEVMGKAEREHSPPAFAIWLVELARRCQVRPNAKFTGAEGVRCNAGLDECAIRDAAPATEKE